jgi:hypothetical protein
MNNEMLTLAQAIRMLAEWRLSLEDASARGFPGPVGVDVYDSEAVRRWAEVNLEEQLAQSNCSEAQAVTDKARFGPSPFG